MLYLRMYYYTFTHGRARTAHGRARTAHGRARTLACACHGRTDMPRTCHGHFLWPLRGPCFDAVKQTAAAERRKRSPRPVLLDRSM